MTCAGDLDFVRGSLKFRGNTVDQYDSKAPGCSPSAFEDDDDAYKPLKGGKAVQGRMLNFSRTGTLAFVDRTLEAEFRSWQARQRWQVCPT